MWAEERSCFNRRKGKDANKYVTGELVLTVTSKQEVESVSNHTMHFRLSSELSLL